MVFSEITINPSSKINAKVELFSGSTLVTTCTCADRLQDFTIERIGQSGKFFGFGIIHKLRVNLIDLGRNLTVTKDNSFKVHFGIDGAFVRPYPTFYVDEIQRDENTNTISVVAYDKLYGASAWKFSDLTLNDSYTFMNLASKCALKLKISSVGKKDIPTTDTSFDTVIDTDNPVNLTEEENFRQIFDALSEATQTVYYLDRGDSLVFRKLNKDGDPLLEITKNDYIDLSSGEVCTLAAICHATELGDNLTATSETATGITQYIRNNPLYELRNDTATLLDNALAVIEGTSITQFTLNWFGNFLLEPVDKISIETEDGGTITSYVLSDVITFDGTMSESTEWEYTEDSAETESNPTSLGDVVTQTTAKVDKVNKQITLLVNDVTEKQASTDSEIKIIREAQTSFTQTANDITLRVESIETDGVTRVDTGTGFTFNEEGLRINKDNSGIENLLDNTGMYVKQDGTQVLAANEEGVKAKDLHAVTYLWIGSHSRFEDYESGRTGCFWIGH